MERRGICFRCRITHHKYTYDLFFLRYFELTSYSLREKCIIQVVPMPISKAESNMCVDTMEPSTSALGLPSYSLIQHLLDKGQCLSKMGCLTLLELG